MQLADARVLVQMDDNPANRQFRDLIQIFVQGFQDFKLVAEQVSQAFDLAIAVGENLDDIGSVVGLPREGFTDARYRVFLEIQTLLLLAQARADADWTGTGGNIIAIARQFVGPTTAAVVLTNHPPYSYTLGVPGLVVAEAFLLARFLKIATYAGVLGQMFIILASDSLWDSTAVAVTGGGIYCSASVAVAGCATYNTVVTTEC